MGSRQPSRRLDKLSSAIFTEMAGRKREVTQRMMATGRPAFYKQRERWR